MNYLSTQQFREVPFGRAFLPWEPRKELPADTFLGQLIEVGDPYNTAYRVMRNGSTAIGRDDQFWVPQTLDMNYTEIAIRDNLPNLPAGVKRIHIRPRFKDLGTGADDDPIRILSPIAPVPKNYFLGGKIWINQGTNYGQFYEIAYSSPSKEDLNDTNDPKGHRLFVDIAVPLRHTLAGFTETPRGSDGLFPTQSSQLEYENKMEAANITLTTNPYNRVTPSLETSMQLCAGVSACAVPPDYYFLGLVRGPSLIHLDTVDLARGHDKTVIAKSGDANRPGTVQVATTGSQEIGYFLEKRDLKRLALVYINVV